MRHEHEFRVGRGDAGLLLVNARVLLKRLAELRCGDGRDFLAPVVPKGEEVGVLGVGTKTGRILLLDHALDEIAVNVERSGREHWTGLERVRISQREIEFGEADRRQVAPDADGLGAGFVERGIVELRTFIGRNENEDVGVERRIGLRVRHHETKPEAHQKPTGEREALLHAREAGREPGTSASDCSSA